MKHNHILVIVGVTASIAILIIPSIRMNLQCPAQADVPPEGIPVYGRDPLLPPFLYIGYLLNGERIAIEGGSCGPT